MTITLMLLMKLLPMTEWQWH